MSFSYAYITDDVTREVAERILTQVASNFLAWRGQDAARIAKPVATAFQNWWMTQGPTAFKTGQDATRFKTEVLDRACVTLGVLPYE